MKENNCAKHNIKIIYYVSILTIVGCLLFFMRAVWVNVRGYETASLRRELPLSVSIICLNPFAPKMK